MAPRRAEPRAPHVDRARHPGDRPCRRGRGRGRRRGRAVDGCVRRRHRARHPRGRELRRGDRRARSGEGPARRMARWAPGARARGTPARGGRVQHRAHGASVDRQPRGRRRGSPDAAPAPAPRAAAGTAAFGRWPRGRPPVAALVLAGLVGQPADRRRRRDALGPRRGRPRRQGTLDAGDPAAVRPAAPGARPREPTVPEDRGRARRRRTHRAGPLDQGGVRVPPRHAPRAAGGGLRGAGARLVGGRPRAAWARA